MKWPIVAGVIVSSLVGLGYHFYTATTAQKHQTYAELLQSYAVTTEALICSADMQVRQQAQAVLTQWPPLDTQSLYQLAATKFSLLPQATAENMETAVGGPEQLLNEQALSLPLLQQLVSQIQNPQEQLALLESLLAQRKVADEYFVLVAPINNGRISSEFGRRRDPLHGHLAWHNGLDMVGAYNAQIQAAAAGIVTWSDRKDAYGMMVEIDHGNGYVTRYAHNRANLVKKGDIVQTGQAIALMGSTGRSTGPHVHFEVWQDGRPVDPSSYLVAAY